MADVSIKGISKNFKSVAAVNKLSLDIANGEFVVLLGPTGAGKTTTLRLIAGLEKPDAGEITIDGQSLDGLAPSSRNVAFVFQQFSLYPHLSVFDNMAFPLRSPVLRMPEKHTLWDSLRVPTKPPGDRANPLVHVRIGMRRACAGFNIVLEACEIPSPIVVGTGIVLQRRVEGGYLGKLPFSV